MSIALSQSRLIAAGNVPNTTFAYNNPVNASDFLVIGIMSGSGPGNVFTVSDDTNGTWNQDFTASSAVYQGAFFSFPNSLSNSVVNVTVTQSLAGQMYLMPEAWTSMITSNPFDQNSAHSAVSATPDSGATGPISQVPELVLGMIGVSGGAVISPGAGYILDKQNTIVGIEYRVVSTGLTTQTATFGLSLSSTYLALIATYRGLTQTGPTPRQIYIMP